LQECIRLLIVRREEQKARLQSLLNEVHRASDATLPLSAETIVELLRQHLSMKHTARLPVLMIAAAYKTAEQSLNARLLPLHPHNAADEQTGALGDLEIMVQGEDQTVTVYEVKHRAVTIADLNAVLRKLARTTHKVAQYMVITTAPVDPEIDVYALSLYSVTGGTEIAVLDCLGFIRHFLHFFHRLRHEFLDVYQALVLAEPESAVDHTLKEAFLILRSNLENPLDE
jgi:DNA adenine methylase